MIEKTLKAITKALILCSVVMFAGCSEGWEPGRVTGGFSREIYFTDNPDMTSEFPEVITISSEAQTVKLSVKHPESCDLRLSRYSVAKWYDEINSWYFVKNSSTGFDQAADFYSISVSEAEGRQVINVGLKANNGEQNRRLLLQADFEGYDDCIPCGVVEIVQTPASSAE